MNLSDKTKKLTKREREIIDCLMAGLITKEIAAKLFIAKYTVDNHRKNILHKLNARNTPELILKYTALQK